MNEVYKVNFCMLIWGLGTWPPEFESSKVIVQAIYCIFTDETEQFQKEINHDCSNGVFLFYAFRYWPNQDLFTKGIP